MKKQAISLKSFLVHSLEAAYHAAVIYYITVSSFSDISIGVVGQISDRNIFSIIIILYTVWMMNIGILLFTSNWTWIPIIFIIISSTLTFVYAAIYSSVPKTVGYISARYIFSSWYFWLNFFLIAVVCFLPRLVLKYFLRTFFPSDTQIAQEIERIGEITKIYPVDDVDTGKLKSKTSSTAPSDYLTERYCSKRLSLKSGISEVYKRDYASSGSSQRKSTLEISDIYHTRESFHLPPLTIPILLQPPPKRRYSFGTHVASEVAELQRRRLSFFLQKPVSEIMKDGGYSA